MSAPRKAEFRIFELPKLPIIGGETLSRPTVEYLQGKRGRGLTSGRQRKTAVFRPPLFNRIDTVYQ
jgi:hypothetical protein